MHMKLPLQRNLQLNNVQEKGHYASFFLQPFCHFGILSADKRRDRRGVNVLKLMVPDLHKSSVYEIDVQALKQQGIKSMLVDLDNTLVESTRPDATPRLVKWLAQVKEMGIQVMILSNNSKTRVSKFAQPLHIPFIHLARKPLTFAFRRALKELGTTKEETVMVGDQLLTDVFGGNRAGLYTILVTPVSNIDGFMTRLNRRVERLIFRLLEKRGLLRWGEKS